MKTVVIILFFIFLMNGNEVNAQKKIKFYYYPAANVYYNTTTATYTFIQNNEWVSAPSLPTSYAIKHTQRHLIYHSDAQVWNNNYHHRLNYAPEAKVIDAGYKESNTKQTKGSFLNGNLLKKRKNL